MAPRRGRVAVIVSCEHARADVPAALRNLGLQASVLRSHVGFDVGALPVARGLARALGVGLHEGRWSRLVADLNRSAEHPRVIAARVSGDPVPGNADLDAEERTARLERYWRGYRETLRRDVAGAVRRGGCVHFSVHSFTDRLGGVERRNDVGLLFDPWRPRERALVDRVREVVLARGFSCRRNFPYFGHTDGMTSWLRGCFPAARYLGVEIELNQRVVRSVRGQRELGQAVIDAVRTAVGG